MSPHPNLVDTSSYEGVLRLEAEVAVVGSGAGGAVAAKELAEGGLRVALLEEGGYYQASDFNQREADMYRRLYRDRGAQATRDLSINILQGRMVGGSTVINNCICFRTPGRVLKRWQHEFGLSGLSLEELAPFFERVESVLGVIPIAPYEVNENNRLLLEGCRRLGYRSGTFLHNRKDCVGCGYCMLGCAYDRHSSVNLNYLPRALEAGAKIYIHSRIEEILVEGGKLGGVRGSLLDPESGKPRGELVVKAPLVVLACGSIHTPALLLGNRLGNRSGEVGRRLALHPVASAFALFDHIVDGFIGLPQAAYCNEFETLEDGSDGFIIEGIFAFPALFAATCPSFGAEHFAFMKDYRRTAAMYAMLKDEGSGTVEAGADGRPLIDYALGERERDLARRGLKEVARIFFAAGAIAVTTVHVLPRTIHRAKEIDRLDDLPMRPNDLVLFSAHPQGTCRMHADPEEGPLDSFGESHDLPNLFVADASVFPTSVGVNPQITIMALATRQADRIRRRLSRPPIA